MLQPDLVGRVAQINGNTLIPLGTFIAIIIFAVKITQQLSSMQFKLEELRSIPKRLAAVEDTLMMFEDDIANLWVLQRGGTPEQTRRSRFRPEREV